MPTDTLQTALRATGASLLAEVVAAALDAASRPRYSAVPECAGWVLHASDPPTDPPTVIVGHATPTERPVWDEAPLQTRIDHYKGLLPCSHTLRDGGFAVAERRGDDGYPYLIVSAKLAEEGSTL